MPKSSHDDSGQEGPPSQEGVGEHDADHEIRFDSRAKPLGSAEASTLFRFVGLGMELAGFTLVLAGLGYWVDSNLHLAKPFATALGALIGFTVGMVRFIQQANKR